MPYQWIEPERAFQYFGVSIYCSYKNNDINNKEKYRFTTAKHEDFESHIYEFDIRDFGAWESEGPEVGDVVKWLIEHQTLKMPTRLGIDYPFKRGSFDWYENHPDVCINRLSKAMIHADRVNKTKMYRMFIHMGNAHQMESWSTTYLKGHVLDAPKTRLTKGRRQLRGESKKTDEGSFFWHLSMSGSFVRNLANAIFYGDRNIVGLICTEYPQMVAASECEDFHKSPNFFTPVYNAGVDSG